MSEREVSEKEINNRLEEIINTPDEKGFNNINHVIRLLSLILFNLRKDYVELYKDIVEFKEKGTEHVAKKIKDDMIFI